MTRNMLGRWVAGASVLAALSIWMFAGGGHFTTQEIVWGSQVVSGVLR
jgi:hypothetical protein